MSKNWQVDLEEGSFCYPITRPLTEKERESIILQGYDPDEKPMSLLGVNSEGIACAMSREDAYLIAAAPEMLEALKEIISIVNSEEAIIRILGEWQTEHADVIEYIEAVIAKAEGKEVSYG